MNKELNLCFFLHFSLVFLARFKEKLYLCSVKIKKQRIMKTRKEYYNEISVLESNPFSGEVITFSNGTKTAEVKYNGRQSSFLLSMKDNGRLVVKGFKSSADAYAIAGMIVKHLNH